MNSASCNILKRSDFLEQTSVSCGIGGDRCKPMVNLKEMLRNVSIFRLPPRSVTIGGDLKWTDLIPIVVRICGEKSADCRTDLAIPDCFTGLLSVKLQVGFNGTQGIRYVLADLIFKNVSTTGPVLFETIYQPINGWNMVSRSGNPGYIQGKPLLVAKFNSSTGLVDDQKTIQSSLVGINSRSINFGEDIFQSVGVQVANRENRTEWCNRWMSFVLESFFSGRDISEWRLAVYGNAQLNQTLLWLPIQLETQQLKCFSHEIKANLIIVYTKSGSFDQPQNKLTNAILQLRSGGSEATCQQMTSSSNNCFFLFTQTVSFVSAEATTLMILPVPPRWRIQLPHDFFYPFLMSSSTALFPVAIQLFYCITLALLIV